MELEDGTPLNEPVFGTRGVAECGQPLRSFWACCSCHVFSYRLPHSTASSRLGNVAISILPSGRLRHALYSPVVLPSRKIGSTKQFLKSQRALRSSKWSGYGRAGGAVRFSGAASSGVPLASCSSQMTKPSPSACSAFSSSTDSHLIGNSPVQTDIIGSWGPPHSQVILCPPQCEQASTSHSFRCGCPISTPQSGQVDCVVMLNSISLCFSRTFRDHVLIWPSNRSRAFRDRRGHTRSLPSA